MKTIEEKAYSHVDRIFSEIIDKYQNAPWNEFRDALAQIYLVGATEALSGQWKDPKVELPDGTPFCVTMADEESRLCLCHFDGDVFIEDYSGLVCEVKYWMPIPFLPPKDENK